MRALTDVEIDERVRALTREGLGLKQIARQLDISFCAVTMSANRLDRKSRILRRIGADLTQRELEVLNLSSVGLTYDDIATELRISSRTVKFHIVSALDKLGADNKTHAVAMAIRQELI